MAGALGSRPQALDIDLGGGDVTVAEEVLDLHDIRDWTIFAGNSTAGHSARTPPSVPVGPVTPRSARPSTACPTRKACSAHRKKSTPCGSNAGPPVSPILAILSTR